MVENGLIHMGRLVVVRYMRYLPDQPQHFPARVYLDDETVCDPRDRARFLAYAQIYGEQGELPTYVHGHWLKGEYSDLYEFKPINTRVLAFAHGTNLYVCHAAPKKKAKAQEADYLHAHNLRVDFLNKLTKKQQKKK